MSLFTFIVVADIAQQGEGVGVCVNGMTPKREQHPTTAGGEEA